MDAQRHAQSLKTDLKFVVGKSQNDLVIKILDAQTGKVIRQIPPEEIIELRERMDSVIGRLLKAKT